MAFKIKKFKEVLAEAVDLVTFDLYADEMERLHNSDNEHRRDIRIEESSTTSSRRRQINEEEVWVITDVWSSNAMWLLQSVF